MKVVTFSIKDKNSVMAEFQRAFEAAQGRKPFTPQSGVYFTSLEAARNFLTPKRLELLHIVRIKKPHSIYALAKQVNRGFPSVLKDVGLLAKHGLIKLSKGKKSARRAVHPSVDYGAINLWINV